ncbi:DUF2637 domain-containing protein [Xylanimonas sp. McL0601]|uniref:DUF2637 domain-containing protein n=1 Tax=Xylanimonas sp. McL0601 TaxID=3414739 RepID=UPI003CE7649A
MSAPRLSFDSRLVLAVVVTLVGLVALVSFVLSFSALADVSAWARVPNSLAWAVPVVLDASVLAYSLAGLVQRSRGECARLSWFLVFLFTLVSIAGNAAHALDVQGPVRTVVATVVAVSAPLSVFLTVHTLGALVAARPELVVEQHRQVEQVKPRVNLPEGDDEGTIARVMELASHGKRHLDIANEVGWSRQRVTHVLRLAAA